MSEEQLLALYRPALRHLGSLSFRTPKDSARPTLQSKSCQWVSRLSDTQWWMVGEPLERTRRSEETFECTRVFAKVSSHENFYEVSLRGLLGSELTLRAIVLQRDFSQQPSQSENSSPELGPLPDTILNSNNSFRLQATKFFIPDVLANYFSDGVHIEHPYFFSQPRKPSSREPSSKEGKALSIPNYWWRSVSFAGETTWSGSAMRAWVQSSELSYEQEAESFFEALTLPHPTLRVQLNINSNASAKKQEHSILLMPTNPEPKTSLTQ